MDEIRQKVLVEVDEFWSARMLRGDQWQVQQSLRDCAELKARLEALIDKEEAK